jgi:signal peptidase II
MGLVGKRLALLMLILATVGCDRVTKRFAAATLADAPARSFMADTVRLEYIENTGAFLGLGASWPVAVRTGLFIVGNSLLLFAMVATAIRRRWSGLALVGSALIVAGGVSNLADRVVRGSVVDFMNVGVGPLRTGIFNVADMAIMLGVAVVVFAGFRSSKEARVEEADGTIC